MEVAFAQQDTGSQRRNGTLKVNLEVGSDTDAKKRDGPKDYLREEGMVELERDEA